MVRSKTPPRKKKKADNNTCYNIVIMIGFFYLFLKLFSNEIMKIDKI